MPHDLSVADAPFDGRWWAPERPDHVVGGRLFLEDEIWSLKLLGWLGEGPPNQQNDSRPTVIHGQVGTVDVTLLSLVPGGWSGVMAGVPYESAFSANTVLCGVHCDESITFAAADVSMVNLNEWTKRNPFRHQIEEGPPLRDIVVFEHPPMLEAAIDGAKAVLHRTFSQRDNFFEFLEIRSLEAVLFEFDSSLSLDDVYFEYVRPMRNLIELVAMERSAMLAFRVLPTGGSDGDWVQVLSGVHRRAPIPAPKHHWELMFGLNDVEFATVLPTWWSAHRKLGYMPDLFLSLYDRGNVGVQFMTAASTLDGYHRHYDPSTDHSRFHYADRLDYLVSRGGPIFSSAVGNLELWKVWVKEARNSVAHRFPAGARVESEWMTTVHVSASIRLLLSLLFLEDAGLSEDQRREAMKRSKEASRVETHLRRVLPEWFC